MTATSQVERVFSFGRATTLAQRCHPDRSTSFVRSGGIMASSNLFRERCQPLRAFRFSYFDFRLPFDYSQLTIHGTPYLSMHIPNPGDQKVLPKGIRDWPPVESDSKMRLPSLGSFMLRETKVPAGLL
jgi:hypothetical protein